MYIFTVSLAVYWLIYDKYNYYCTHKSLIRVVPVPLQKEATGNFPSTSQTNDSAVITTQSVPRSICRI